MSTLTSADLEIYTPPPNPSPKLQRVLSFFAALDEWNFEKVVDNFDHTLEHQILPKSLNRPTLDYEGYKQLFRGIMPVFKHYKAFVHEVVESDDVIAVHATSTGISVTDAQYVNELTLFIHFAPIREGETLPKISLFKELVDGAKTLEFFASERAKAEARNPGAGEK